MTILALFVWSVKTISRYFDAGVRKILWYENSFEGVLNRKHAGTMLHGFLSYLMKCVMYEKDKIFGYKENSQRQYTLI